ncbi:MAG: 5-(carboxyamino)imidazole ribonucleotide synthase [Cyanobacteria bacterium J06642_2]
MADLGSLPLRLGIIGGGQLGRMTAIAAHQLGIATSVLHPSDRCPAAPVSQVYVGQWTHRDDLWAWAQQVDVITLEHEFTPADDLLWLAKRGAIVHPGGNVLSVVQDKWRQRQHLKQAGLPVPEFLTIDTRADLDVAAEKLGLPLAIKTRRQGYDGHGTAIASTIADLDSIWTKFTANQPDTRGLLMAEAFVPFKAELAVMVARRSNGERVSYPVTVTVQENYVCDRTLTPAPIPLETATRAREIAEAAVEAIDAIGIVGVELFLSADGRVSINELAPRPHNSGHYTIDACATNQFEQHIRAALDLPLGNPEAIAPAAVTVNLLGTQATNALKIPLEKALSLTDVHLHWYGKVESRPGRKLGHITAIASTLDEALSRATQARASLNL